MSEPDVAAWTRQQVEARLSLARAAGGREWRTGCTCEGDCPGYPSCERVEGDDITIYSEGGHDAMQAEHIAANDPQDTIARCEAELAILDEHDDVHSCPGALPGGARPWDYPYVGCRTVRLLASGYRHRPGYEEAWKPDKQG